MIVFALDRGGAMIMIAGELDRRLAGRIVAQHRTAGSRRHVQQVRGEGGKADDRIGSSGTHKGILGVSVRPFSGAGQAS